MACDSLCDRRWNLWSREKCCSLWVVLAYTWSAWVLFEGNTSEACLFSSSVSCTHMGREQRSEELAQPTRSCAFRVTTDSSGGHTASHTPTDIWKLGLFEIQCSQRSFNIVYTTDFYTTHLLLIFPLQIYQGGWIACSLRILATDPRFLSVPLPASFQNLMRRCRSHQHVIQACGRGDLISLINGT